jgi:hypothetical protein
MRILKNVVFLLAATLSPLAYSAGSGAIDYQTALYGPPPAHAALYSYSDVFRLTVAGAAMADFPLAAVAEAPALPDAAVRVMQADAISGYVFSIRRVQERERWILILSGIAAALWVAWRRLANPI